MRRRTDPLDPEEMLDQTLRKSVFREYGRHLSRDITEGFVTDRPGEIARLMERAFKAGIAAAQNLEVGSRAEMDPADRRPRDILEVEVTNASHSALFVMRLYALERTDGHEPLPKVSDPRGLILFFRPPVPGNPFSPKTGQWLLGAKAHGDPFSGKAMSFFLKNELMDVRELERGWKVGTVNEWGLEFLAKGRTANPEGRRGRRSSLAAEWDRAMETKPTLAAAIALGLVAEESTPGPRRS